MPFGTPTPGNRGYALTARSVAKVDGYPLVVNCAFESDSVNADGIAAIFQTFVDLLAASSTFTVQSAQRVQNFNENVTPTP